MSDQDEQRADMQPPPPVVIAMTGTKAPAYPKEHHRLAGGTMNRARYTRLLANLNYKVALAVSNSGDMLEIEDQPAEVTQEEVLRFTDDIRKTLLWIERASAGVN